MDESLRALLRRFEAEPTDDLADALDAAFARASVADLPLPVLARVARWRRLSGLVRKWFERPLDAPGHEGATTEELDAAAKALGGMPRTLREAYRLLGRREDLLGPAAHVTYRLIPLHELRYRGRFLHIVRSERPVWHLRREELGQPDPLVWAYTSADSPLSEFCLALALFCLMRRADLGLWSNAWRDGLATGVRGGAHWSRDAGGISVEGYAPVPVWLKHAVESYLGDADTLMKATPADSAEVVTRTDQAWVLTRTDEAWERACARLGPLTPFGSQRDERPTWGHPMPPPDWK